MTTPRLLLFDPMALLAAAARQGGATKARETRDRLVALGRAGAVERHALCARDAAGAREWFVAPGVDGVEGGLGLLACADRVYATGEHQTPATWGAWLRHALVQARVAPGQALLLGPGPALPAARALSLPAHGTDDATAALAWAEARLRQRYGACPGALGTAWGKASGRSRAVA